MHNWGFLAGVTVGVLVGLILIFILLRATKTDGSRRCRFDERQRDIRGMAYKYGFAAFVAGDFLYALLLAADVKIPVQPSFMIMAIVLFAMLVQVVYCIWNDAYFALNESPARVLVVFMVIGAMNLIIGILGILQGRAVEDGVLTFRAVNLLCGILFLVIFAAILLKRLGAGAGREDE